MKIDAEQVLCRFQLSTFARHHDEPLYQWIVHTAHHEGLQGATVLKGFLGLRPGGSVLHESDWGLAQELPVIVEVVDGPRHVEKLIARVEPEFREGRRARSRWSARMWFSIGRARPPMAACTRWTSSHPRTPVRRGRSRP